MSKKNLRVLAALSCDVANALQAPGARRWLRRGRLRRTHAGRNLLARVCAELDIAPPTAGLAALRHWGQTRARPPGWLAAADPVWLQAGLDKLFLHQPPAGDVSPDSLAEIFRELQIKLFADDELRLESIGELGYLHSPAAFATAAIASADIDGERPDEHMPAGDGADRYLQLNGELQMALHEHPYNVQREHLGQQPVNALWLWGGGEAAALLPRELPTLFSDDPLCCGYWLQSAARCDAAPEFLSTCLDSTTGDLIADFRDATRPSDEILAELGSAVRAGAISHLTLMFADRTCIDYRPGDRYRFWRRAQPATGDAA